MSVLMNLRGITCRFCGHNTRMFSPVCGKCHQRKSLVQRLPIILLPAVAIVVLLVVVATAGLLINHSLAR